VLSQVGRVLLEAVEEGRLPLVEPLETKEGEAGDRGEAVLAAAAMDPAIADLGIHVRAGVHTGEVAILGGQARGVAVHAAARVAGLAGPGEVLASGTTHDLLDGSGLSFEFRGAHELKGLSGARPIFALVR
jgi:class 3 adenylate cyclase